MATLHTQVPFTASMLQNILGRVLSYARLSHHCPRCQRMDEAVAAYRAGPHESPPQATRIPKLRRPDVEDRRVRHGRIMRDWSRKPSNLRSHGLYNQGNTCYRNALLQCLIHSSEFYDYIDNLHREETCLRSTESCVPCALKRLIDAYRKGQGLQTAVRMFNNVVLRATPTGHDMYSDFANDNQADPFDFLEYLLNELRAVEWVADAFKIEDLSRVSHETEWKCSKCKTITTHQETPGEAGHGYGMSVNILEPGRHLYKMSNYLRLNGYREKLRIRCESAECLQQYGEDHEGHIRIRRKYITQAPELLIVRLGRLQAEWNHESDSLITAKVSDEIDFDEILSLGEFTRSGKSILYKLQSVVAHSGTTIDSGHYIAAVRSFDGASFHSINGDHPIRKEQGGSVVELQEPKSLAGSFDPYLLFYGKVDLVTPQE